jgi:putative ABC transport system permease protein
VAGLRVSVRVAASAGPRSVTLRPVSTKYFETAGIPVVAGRQFSPADLPTAPRVALVNAAFVRDVLEDADGLGLRLTPTLVDAPLTVVGIVGDVTPAGTADRPALYVPIDQFGIGGGNLLVRTDRDPAAIVPELTAWLRSVAPALALDRVRPVADSLEAGRAVTRFNTQIAAAFSGLALLLAAIGVYGLTAGEVTARWRELAVRLALGATRREALWSVMRPSAALLIAGLSLGVVASLALGPWLASRVQGIETTDVPAYLIAPTLLGAIGLAATALAAQRVLGADPAATLRQE